MTSTSLVDVLVMTTGCPEMVEVMVYGQREVEVLVYTVTMVLVTGAAVTWTSMVVGITWVTTVSTVWVTVTSCPDIVCVCVTGHCVVYVVVTSLVTLLRCQ